MYLPYLRGKQYELLALRELATEMVKSKIISPLIEPVKINSSSLERAIDHFIETGLNFTLILNPSVGELVGKQLRILELIQRKLHSYDNFQIGIIIDNDYSIAEVNRLLSEIKKAFKFSLIHNYIPVDKGSVKEFILKNNVVYNIINFSKVGSRRYYREFSSKTVITLEDKFLTKNKNSEYSLTPDEFFSEEHLYYESEGFIGFSDFLTIGEPYSESGFLPYAVAIHITYKADEKKIRIRHFVSDSNEDTIDVPGKFDEALQKLVDSIREMNLNTKACREFLLLNDKEHYPGLGSIKKLSIMNHIELIIQLLS